MIDSILKELENEVLSMMFIFLPQKRNFFITFTLNFIFHPKLKIWSSKNHWKFRQGSVEISAEQQCF